MPGDDADLAARMDEVVQKGRAEFEGFDNSSNFVVTMSADQTALRHALGELGDDAHRVVARLADDPDEAARLLALRGTKLGAAIAKFAAKTAAPAVERAAPPPKPEPVPPLYDPTLSTKAWAKAWDKRHEGREPYKPKVTDIYDPNISMADFDHAMSLRERARREEKRFR